MTVITRIRRKKCFRVEAEAGLDRGEDRSAAKYTSIMSEPCE
jgi:hypothetical protein